MNEQALHRIRLANPDIQVDSVREHRGQFNDVLVVNDEYVFRFPRSPATAGNLAREIDVLAVIQGRVTLSIPDPGLSHRDPDSGDWLFMGYPLIPGEPLTYGVVHQDNRETLARQLAEFLRELHVVPLDLLPDALETGELPVGWASFYREVCDHIFPHIREESRGRISRQFEAYFEDPGRYSFETRLRHGDFGIGNILWDPEAGRVTGIIDFGSCWPGDPAQDLGALLVSFGSAFVEAMYPHYPDLESMYDRAVFYTGTYALQQALAAHRAGDEAMFEDGIARFR